MFCQKKHLKGRNPYVAHNSMLKSAHNSFPLPHFPLVWFKAIMPGTVGQSPSHKFLITSLDAEDPSWSTTALNNSCRTPVLINYQLLHVQTNCDQKEQFKVHSARHKQLGLWRTPWEITHLFTPYILYWSFLFNNSGFIYLAYGIAIHVNMFVGYSKGKF